MGVYYNEIDPLAAATMREAVRIPLSNGGVTLVSPNDEALVRDWSWHGVRVNGGKRYAMRSSRVGGRRAPVKTTYLHRFLIGAEPGQIVDHINGDGLDNRRENLRIADATLNCANRRRYSPESGFRGVYRSGRFWRAVLQARGKTIRGGSFACKEEAARKYDELAREHFGSFAVLNFPEGD